MRSAPAPDLLPIPGMNQGVVVGAGAGGSGGGDGNAGDGGDGEGAGGGSGGDDASGDNRNAPDYEKYPTCGTESHPVDVVTGRVFTHPITDLALPGPLPFTFQRSYSSSACKEDQGLGWGWGHSLGWFVEVERRRVRVWNEKGVSVSFPLPEIGHQILGDWGWVLRRELWGFAVDANDEVWRVFSVTFDEGSTFRLSAIDDRNKNRIALTYDDGRLAEVKDSAGRIIKVTSTKYGHIASLQVKNAEHQGQWISFARYEYDDKGRLVRVTDADDYSWTYAYDEYDRLVRDTDRVGLSFCFRYDEKDRGIEAWGEYVGKKDPSLAEDVPKFLYDGRTRAKGIYHRKFDYHKGGYTEVTDTTETRRYYGNRKGTLDKAVMGGAVTTSRYDERGFEVEKTDPMGGTRRWVRDDRGRVLEDLDPLGRRTRIERDAHGLAVAVVNPAGGTPRAVRDSRGNVELLTDPTGATTQYRVDGRGLLTRITRANGATTERSFDAHGNTVDVVQPNGGRWTFAYDGLGRMVSMRDPLGSEKRYAYSDRGDLTAVYDAVGGVTRYAYDGERHLVEYGSPLGHTTQFTWGGFHKLCTRRDASGAIVRSTYSREGELVAVTNERGEVHRLTYNAAGKLIEEETFDGRHLRYRHDLCDRQIRMETGDGQVTAYAYDLAGQLVEVTLPDEATETYEYNPCGELVRATGAGGEFCFERDALGRVTREAQRVGGVEHWIDVAYDPVGGRVARKTSLDHVEEIERDVMGARVRTVLDGTRQVSHVNDLLAREVQRRLPRGGTIESKFDAAGRLAERTAGSLARFPSVRDGQPEWIGRRDDGITSSTSYRYDADNEETARVDRFDGLTRYDYDPVGRLIALVPERARSEIFRYDAAGNLFEAGADAPAREHGPGNRLLRRGDTRYAWDDAGRLSSKSTRDAATGVERVWRYQWDGRGLLRAAEGPSGERIDFTYDPFARRVHKRVKRRSADALSWVTISATRFVWDGDVLVHEIREAARHGGDSIIEERTYLFEDDSFVPAAHRAVRRASATSGDVAEPRGWVHYVNDPAGEPERLVDEDGTVAGAYHRKAWGALVADPAARADTPLRLQGQYWDEETGLAYNRFRYFDPELGDFVSADPLGLRGGLNGYTLAPNAYSWTDPLGLAPAPAGLPDVPGIYIITNKTTGEAYVGSAGIGAGGMASRVGDADHPAQALRAHPDTVVQYKKVCLGSATDPSDRNNILRTYEKQEFDRTQAKGFNMLNKDQTIQSPAKAATAAALASAAGASKDRNPSTAN